MLLIIDNYDSFTYNLYQGLAPYHPHIRVIRNDRTTIDEIKRSNPIGIVLSPGPGRPEDAGICIPLIHALLTGDMQPTPLLGVCLGHQAITLALGGKVIQSQEIAHGKTDLVFHEKKGLYSELTLPFQVGRYHSLIAERETLPSALVIDAENKDKLIMGIRHRKLPIYGMQFHPESILTPEGSHLLRAFVEVCVQSSRLQEALI